MTKLTQEEREKLELYFTERFKDCMNGGNSVGIQYMDIPYKYAVKWWLSQIDEILEERDAQSYEAGRKAEREEIVSCISQEFTKMTYITTTGDYKYWRQSYFGYAQNDTEYPMDKLFPQEVHDKIINSINSRNEI